MEYFWKVWLRLNLLTKDVENDYTTEVSTKGNTKGNEDIASRIIEEVGIEVLGMKDSGAYIGLVTDTLTLTTDGAIMPTASLDITRHNEKTKQLTHIQKPLKKNRMKTKRLPCIVQTRHAASLQTKMRLTASLLFLLVIGQGFSLNTTRYVSTNGTGTAATATSWANACNSIQAAIEASVATDTIIVADGTYAPISSGNKAITIRSVNGADVTFIDGSNTTRCATLGTAAGHTATVLNGFTLTNGKAGSAASYGNFGGGALYGTFINCTFSANAATSSGGGAAFATLSNCVLADNTAGIYGGGAYNSTLNNCTIYGNIAASGGGTREGTLNNCILYGNTAEADGGGIYTGTLNNCTVWGNKAQRQGGGAANDGERNNCIIWGNTAPSYVNISGGTVNSTFADAASDPLFVAPTVADFRLKEGSPCIGAGATNLVVLDTDMNGEVMIQSGKVNQGALAGAVSEWLSIAPEQIALAAAQSGNVALSVCSTNAWFASTDAPWITLTNASGMGNGNVFFNISLNDSGEPRSASITVTTDIGLTASLTVSQSTGIWYVSETGDNTTGATPATAFRQITQAIAVAAAGDAILVDDGDYSAIATANKAITIQSVNGAGVTFIEGGTDVRAADLGSSVTENKTVLTGFTLHGGILSAAERGGGVRAGTLNNCIITGNSAPDGGGGAYHATLNNCIISNNASIGYGGGSNDGVLNNCLIVDNTAANGGGSCGETLNNCTLYGNTASIKGGGAYNSTHNNCISWGNTSDVGPNICNDAGFTINNTTYESDPLFADAVNGNFRLQENSPCINTGSDALYNATAYSGVDLDGNPRFAGTIDRGAYEYYTCPRITTLRVDNITAGTAVISWTAGGEETEWNVVVSDTAVTNFEAYAPFGAITENPYTITGLSELTTYYVYIRAVCSVNDQSLWLSGTSFTTTSCPMPADIVIDDITADGATISWTAGGEETEWNLIVSDSVIINFENVESTNIIQVTDNPVYIAKNLIPGILYHVYLQADCDETYQSAYISTTFRTSLRYWTDESIRAAQYMESMNNDTLCIYSASELGLLAYELQNDTSLYYGKTIHLMSNIDLSTFNEEACYWQPMPASGINFNGNGMRIRNMMIEDEPNLNGNDYAAGFFSNIKESIVHDVLFENPEMIIRLNPQDELDRRAAVGIVAGYAERMGIADVIIENPSILLKHHGENGGIAPIVGAVIGYSYGYDEPSSIPGIIVPLNSTFIQGVDVLHSDISVNSAISLEFTGNKISNFFVGSMAGALYKSSISSTQSNINILVDVNQNINTIASSRLKSIGGIVGYTSTTQMPDFNACVFNNLYNGEIILTDNSNLSIHKGGIAGYVLNDDVINNIAIGSGWTTKYGSLNNMEGFLPESNDDIYNFSYDDINAVLEETLAYLTSKTPPNDLTVSLEGAGGLWLTAYLTMGHVAQEVGIAEMDYAFTTQRSLEKVNNSISFNWWLLGTITDQIAKENDLYENVLIKPSVSLVLTATGAIDTTNSGWEISNDGLSNWEPLSDRATAAHHEKYIRYKTTYLHNTNMGVNKVSYSNVAQLILPQLTPANAAEHVALNAEVSVSFGKNITEAELTGISISPDPGAVSASITGNTLIIAHNDFAYNTEYTVTIPAGTIAEYPGSIVWSFETESITVGLDDIGVETRLIASVYPNPMHDMLYINLRGFENLEGLGIQMVSIYSLSGMLVKTWHATSLSSTAGAISVDVSALPSGVYNVMVKTDDGENVAVKVVKK